MNAPGTAVLIAIAATLAVGVLGGCKSCADPPSERDAESDDGSAARPSRGPAATAELAWRGGSVDAACTGRSIDLANVLGEPPCAITSATAKALRAAFESDAASKDALRQEARRGDDGRLELRLVNRGTQPVTLPLSWHPRIAAFVVLASNPTAKAVYELEPPALEVARGDDGDAGGARFARIVLPPDGVAVARIAVDPKIAKRVDPPVVDAAPRLAPPAALAAGKWTLHVGQLVTDVETGEPATLTWVVP